MITSGFPSTDGNHVGGAGLRTSEFHLALKLRQAIRSLFQIREVIPCSKTFDMLYARFART